MKNFVQLNFMFKFIKLLFYLDLYIKIKTWLVFIVYLLILLILSIILVCCLPEINNITADVIEIPFNTIDISDKNMLIKNKIDPIFNILNLNNTPINISKFETSYFCNKNTIINDSKANVFSSNNKVFLSEMFRLAEHRSESLRLHHDLYNMVNKLVEEYNQINVK